MTWDDSLDFCQSAGLRGVSLGTDKTEEEVEDLMELVMDEQLKMNTFWVAGYVMHPPELRFVPIVAFWFFLIVP
jgi:hypothetical protein